MARPGGMPAWVPAVAGVVLVIAVGGPLLERHVAGPPAAATPASGSRAAIALPPAPAELPPLRFTEVDLGAPRVTRFAFDPAVAGRVVSCSTESRDGGRTWTLLDAAAPVPVPIDSLCAPPTVPGDAAPGGAGAMTIWAAGRDGTGYASVTTPGRRPHLAWAPTLAGPWQDVPTPGDVRALTVDGERAYAVAGMFGRGWHESWDWTRWPQGITVRGVTAHRSIVVAWGHVAVAQRGGYVISRDGGATLQHGVHGRRPAWAALDPHQPSQLLVLGEDGGLSRLSFQ